MPFASCQRCGRLFHSFDPTLPEAPDGYWPNLRLGDAVHEFCPECLKIRFGDKLRVRTYENWGRVVRHENGGVTVVELTDSEGVPFNSLEQQVPTDCIPVELRPIGTRFYFQWDGISTEDADSPEELRAHCRTAFRVLRAAGG